MISEGRSLCSHTGAGLGDRPIDIDLMTGPPGRASESWGTPEGWNGRARVLVRALSLLVPNRGRCTPEEFFEDASSAMRLSIAPRLGRVPHGGRRYKKEREVILP